MVCFLNYGIWYGLYFERIYVYAQCHNSSHLQTNKASCLYAMEMMYFTLPSFVVNPISPVAQTSIPLHFVDCWRLPSLKTITQKARNQSFVYLLPCPSRLTNLSMMPCPSGHYFRIKRIESCYVIFMKICLATKIMHCFHHIRQGVLRLIWSGRLESFFVDPKGAKISKIGNNIICILSKNKYFLFYTQGRSGNIKPATPSWNSNFRGQ